MQICEWLKVNYIDLSYEKIILNNVYDNPKCVENSIFLIAKKYIYNQRCLNKSLFFAGLKDMVRSIRKIELYNAKSNDRVKLHELKWEHILF